MSTGMNKISGLTLAVTLVVGVGGGYALRMITTRGAVETSPPRPGAIAATSPAENPGVAELQARLDQTEGELAEARCALGSAGGINAYHDGDYPLAIQLYDEALKCDRQDGYVLSLKAYSLFKTGDLGAAIATQRASLESQPDYALGYFNLARFLCATGDFEAAAAEVATAVSLWPEVEEIAGEDGEYQKLCQGRATP